MSDKPFTENPFKPATKHQTKLRMALYGVSGGGKTFTGLSIATALGKTAVIDTERGSARKYSDQFQFDVLELEYFAPAYYMRAIEAAIHYGYEVLLIDSLSHAWQGVGGVLEMVDNANRRSTSGNSFAAWRDVTPVQNQLVDTILQSNVHIIATMRAKTEYVLEQNSKGKTAPRKIGLAPIQRDNMEYEFDIVAEMDIDNNLVVVKSRCPQLTNAVIAKPGVGVAATLNAWISDGEPTPPPEPIKLPQNENSAPAGMNTSKPAQTGGNGASGALAVAKNESSDSWASRENVDKLFGYWYTEALTDVDILAAVGCKNKYDLKFWSQYATPPEASAAIKSGHRQRLEQIDAPPEPEGDSLEDTFPRNADGQPLLITDDNSAAVAAINN